MNLKDIEQQYSLKNLVFLAETTAENKILGFSNSSLTSTPHTEVGTRYFCRYFVKKVQTVLYLLHF